jgi:hypothetical protein
MFLEFPEFLENNLLHERNVLEKWGTRRVQTEGFSRTKGEVRKLHYL